MMISKSKDPFVRIVKRNDISTKKKWLIRGIFVTSVIIISLLFLFVISGKNPFISFFKIIEGTFNFKAKSFDKFLKTSTMNDVVMLFMIALALIPAYKMKFWNIGAQGQILVGALACAVIMINCSNLPSPLVIIMCIIGATTAGAIWGAIPAIFKALWNTNETLFTLMMNYIAIQLVAFCTENWRGEASAMGQINLTSKVGWLPEIANISWLLPLIIVLILMVVMFFYLGKTKHGYEIRVVGESTETAKYAGINVKKVIIRTVAISGGLCGLVGFFYVCGFSHTISSQTSGGYGFTAIIACWLAKFNPFLASGYSFLIVFLERGAANLQNANLSLSLNTYSCQFIFLLVIVSIMAIEFFINYEVVFRKKKKQEVTNENDIEIKLEENKEETNSPPLLEKEDIEEIKDPPSSEIEENKEEINDSLSTNIVEEKEVE